MATLAGAWFGLSVLYVENKQFHDFVFNLFSRFPRFLQEFVVGLVIPIVLLMMKSRTGKEPSDGVQRGGNIQDKRV